MFDPSVYLAYGDVEVDNLSLLRYLQVSIKASKTDTFHQGLSIFIG